MIYAARFRAVRPRPARLEQAIVTSIPATIASGVLYWLYYYLESEWQLLAVAAGSFLALGGLALSFALNRRHRPLAAAYVLLASLLAVLGVVPLFVAGLAVYICMFAALLIFAVGASVLPGRWRAWLAIAAVFGLYTWLVEWLAPLPRFAPESGSLSHLYLLGASAAFLSVNLLHSALVALRAFTSIRARLIITCLVLVLFAGGAITYFPTVVMMHQEQSDAVTRLSVVATRKESQLEAWTNSLHLALTMFAHHTTPQLAVLLAPGANDRAGYNEALRHVQEDIVETFSQLRLYDELFVADAAGNPILPLRDPNRTRQLLDAECLAQALAGQCLRPPRHYPALGHVAVVAAVPVLDASGRAIGVIGGHSSLAALTEITSTRDGLGETGVTYLVGADGMTLASTQVAELPEASAAGRPDLAQTPAADLARAAHSSGIGFYTDARGVSVVTVYRWLPRLQIALLVGQEQAEAFRPATRLLDVHLGVTFVLLVTAAATALYMVRGINAPLRHLAVTAERIADGSLDLAADVQQNDEIGALARSFNKMTARLRETHDQLEQRVQQRTEELARMNAELQSENTERRRVEQSLKIESGKLKRILDAMDDGVYIVNQQFDIEYANPALEREFGPRDGHKCYAYLYGRSEVCHGCPNDQVWQGVSVRREETIKDGKTYELFDTLLTNADGTLAKLAIFHDVTTRKQAEEEVLQRNRELGILSRRLVEIQESERQYISRELHDETGQALTSLMLRLGMLERDMQRGISVADRVAELKQTVEEVLEGLHGLAMDLRPSSLDHVGLVPALRQYAERTTERHGLLVDFGALGLGEQRLPQQMEITIYRIVQEALVNVVRHAQATHADVILERRPGQVRVIVEDNGRGFDMTEAMYSGRLGLLGMRERVEMLGGRLMIDSAPGMGTMVLVEVPYDGSYPDSR